MVRTAVVAVATLAILLVVFSMYQYSQLSVATPESARPPRLPSLPTQLSAADSGGANGKPSGVAVGPAVIGTSQNVTISLYPREGQQAKLELTVSDWAPKDGSDHEFLLRDPDIRMRTNEGNDVRVTAREGNLEARRKGGSGLEPQRGKLSGNVVIEFDRRTDAEKAKLPEALRAKPDPNDIVRAEAGELEFDVEFGRLTIPGRLTLSARDVSLEALDLEVRFDERRGRVESLRIDRGGRLELIDQSTRLRVSMPGVDKRAEQQQTIADWLRATVQARLDATQAQRTADSSSPSKASPPAPVKEKDGVPVFRAVERDPAPRTAVRYYGRFEGDVDARQLVGDTTQSRLQADELEILRDFSPQERQNVQRPGEPTDRTDQEGADQRPSERVVLTWSGRLLVETLSLDDPRRGESGRSRITATGTPARLSHPEGDATCAKLSYDPDGGEVRLYAAPAPPTRGDATAETAPVVVRSLEQGSVSGRSVLVHREGDVIELLVGGPGRMVGDMSPGGRPLPSPGVHAGRSEPPDINVGARGTAVQPDAGRREIEFASELHATGRVVRKKSLDFTGTITAKEYRLLDHVTFAGRTMLHEGDTSLEADSLAVDFANRESWREIRQGIGRVVGAGQVVMTQGRDRLTCDKIDVTMGLEPDGSNAPRTAIASGDVVAIQGDRTLEARDRLIIDFERIVRRATDKEAEAAPRVWRPGPPAVARTTQAADSSSRGETAVVARRLRAFGGVTVFDPSQPLDISCDQLDCTISDGRQIESAVVTGADDRPATVRLDTFSVTGREVSLNVPDQWAEVPGRGRMTFQSRKDLDGRKVAEPIPIAVTWTEHMKYRGRENRAVFSGDVHATSEATTTFDCAQLLVEFEDATPREAQPPPAPKIAWGLPSVLSRLLTGKRDASSRIPIKGFSKEPRYIEATGTAVAETAELDPSSGRMKSRARISGPKLSVHLRSELSKLLIEGPGNLQLEDFRPVASPAASKTGSAERPGTDLFSADTDAGPSKTLIQWRDRMWYDFAIDQTLFEGGVQLTHLSGEELEKVFGVAEGGASSGTPGRRTFLGCDALTVDFLDRTAGPRRSDDQRMGRLSSDRLRQFRALGTVVLRDEVERLSLTAEEIVYERPRKILLIHGTKQRKAQIIKQSSGRLPDQVSAERLFYNLATGQIEVVQASVKGGA
jgi:lipopolysaccharide export system protein LptA